MLGFETDLAKAQQDARRSARPRSANYHKMTVADLDKTRARLRVECLLRQRRFQGNPAAWDVGQPEFATAAAHLIATAPLDDVKTYLRWQLLHARRALPEQGRSWTRISVSRRRSREPRKNLPRWKRVLTATDHGLGEALGHLYVAKNFPPEAKARALELVNDLKSVLRERP